MWKGVAVILILTGLASVQSLTELPDFIHVCNKNDPMFSECMAKTATSMRPYFIEGRPEIGIPKIEPLELGEVDFNGFISGFGIKLNATNIKVYGASNFIVKEIKTIEYARKYKINLEFPQMYAIGSYSVEGRFNFLPLNGKGFVSANFSHGSTEVRIKLEPKVIKNETHCVVSRLANKLDVKNGRMNLNLFEDKVLNDLFSSSLNDDFAAVSKEFSPLAERILSKAIKKLVNTFMYTYTEAQLFP